MHPSVFGNHNPIFLLKLGHPFTIFGTEAEALDGMSNLHCMLLIQRSDTPQHVHKRRTGVLVEKKSCDTIQAACSESM